MRSGALDRHRANADAIRRWPQIDSLKSGTAFSANKAENPFGSHPSAPQKTT
jgi:hypothetical protein